MFWLDWIIVVIPLIIVMWIGLMAQKYVKGVSDFLTAGRVAGRYVLAVASGEAGMGLISLVAIFEMYYSCGFAISFWSKISAPLGMIFGLTGFCVYRFRETRAMTMGQFFEIRYSRSFRFFAAILQSISGILNYAIFPAVGARTLVYFLDLPITFQFLGITWSSYAMVMLACLLLAVVIITMGGQITIMVTDCVQGIISYPMYVVIVVYILWRFSWSDEMAPILEAQPAGKSFLNPYDISELRTFNLFYVVVGIFSSILNRMSWSGNQGYSAAAATPHEQKMGGLLGTWRGGVESMMYILIAVAAFTYLNHRNFMPLADKANLNLAVKTIQDVTHGSKKFDGKREALIAQITAKGFPSRVPGKRLVSSAASDGIDNYDQTAYSAIRKIDKSVAKTYQTLHGQMLVPLAVREMFPIGITGIFCALMIFLMVSTDTTYIHSWGSILVQDIVLPAYGKPFKPETQLMLLRIAILCVAVIAFFFSLFFAQLDYILMFFSITGAIWLGGAGPVITFGLYWKRGTTAGAYCSLISGGVLAVGGLVCQKLWVGHLYPLVVQLGLADAMNSFLVGVSAPFDPWIKWSLTPDSFPINSQEIYFIAILISVSLYVVVSLITCKKPFDMDKMLHRGKYAHEGKIIEKIPNTVLGIIQKLVGITGEYTKGDKILAWSIFIYSFGYGFILNFIVIIVWNAIRPWPIEWWGWYFFWTSIVITGVIGAISTVWFFLGSTFGLVDLFKALKLKHVNELDDGRVEGNVSTGDMPDAKAGK